MPEVYSLLLEENTWLKMQKKVPEMDFLREKFIVEKLESSLSSLKKLNLSISLRLMTQKNWYRSLIPNFYKFFIWIGK